MSTRSKPTAGRVVRQRLNRGGVCPRTREYVTRRCAQGKSDPLHGIRVATRGDALLSPAITRRLISEYLSRPSNAGLAAGLDDLTNREREAVALAARGLSNDEIATQMVISPTTAKTHISRAMTKLHARDRAQLVVLAYESGLVIPKTPRRGSGPGHDHLS